MKKIFTFFIAIATVSFASAQSYRQPDRSYADRNEKHYSDNRYNKNVHDYDYRNSNYNNDNYGNYNYNDRRRQEQIGRINRDYDQRIDVCRNDRRISQRERERRVYQINTERNQKLKSFGAGAVAGIVLGAILSH